MGPWGQGLFGTYSSFSPIMTEQKCVCGHVWGDPVPTNCRVLRADGHFKVGRQDPVLPVLSVMGPWVQGLFGTYSSLSPTMAEQKCVCGHVWGDPVPTNCRVLRVDGHFTVGRTLYYPYYQLWVPGSKGYLVHIAPFPPQWQNRNAYVAMFGVTLSPQTAASLGRMVILR